jgi:hypothetical protein
LRNVFLVAFAAGSLSGGFPSTQRSTEEGFKAEIPSADYSKLKDVRDARNWHNPMVLILADAVEIRSLNLTGGRIRVGVGQLRQELIKLPVSAWPYGRIVLAQGPGLPQGGFAQKPASMGEFLYGRQAAFCAERRRFMTTIQYGITDNEEETR